jgi:hypothetical protein
MVTKPQSKEFDYRVEKLRELSAMGGFPVTREAAEQAVTKADEISLPDLVELTKEAEKQIAAGASPSRPKSR